MRTTIYPIYKEEVDGLMQLFFGNKFENQRLGQSGSWLGKALLKLPLENPVRQNDFGDLLFSDQNTFRKKEPVAWHMVFEVGRSATTLWALGDPKTQAGIEEAHRFGIRNATEWLATQICEKPHLALFASFQSGTGEFQIPYLHSDVFLINRDFGSAPNKHFSNEEVLLSQQGLDTRYVIHFAPTLATAVGDLDADRHTEVKRRLFRGFRDEHFGGKRLEGQELFKAWHAEANSQGWGPDRAQSVLKIAREYRVNRQHFDLHDQTAKKARTTFSDWLKKITMRQAHKHSH